MKLQPDHQPPPFLNRRDQYRLLAMVGVLCLVMVAIKLTAQPSAWHWLVPPESVGVSTVPSLEEIDFRVPSPGHTSLAADEFRLIETDDELVADLDESQLTRADVKFPEEVLKPIQDNTVGLRRKELAAYELMLTRIDELSDDEMNREARDDVAFTVLMLQSEDYRGQLLSVRGDMRRLTKFPAPKASRFDTLYEGWLFTKDSGTNPYRIVFTQRPSEIPLSDAITPPVPVQVTGYFFKRYGYASQGGQHVAPLLLSKLPTIIPAISSIPGDGSELREMMLVSIGAVTLAVIGLAAWFFFSDRRYRRGRLSQLADSRLDMSAEDLAALEKLPTIDTDHPFAEDVVEPPQAVT